MLKIGTLPTDVAQWLNDNNVPVPSESVGNAHTRRYNEVKREIRNNYGDEKEKQRKLDLLKYQLNEIQEAKLKKDEEEKLEEKRKIMLNSEKIAKNLSEASQAVGENTIDVINSAVRALEKIEEIDSKYSSTIESLRNIYYEMQEISRDIETYCEDVDFDEQQREEVETRLDIIYDLKRKYGNNIEEILEYGKEVADEINKIENAEEINAKLRKEKSELETELNVIAMKISEIRKKYATELNQRINKELLELEMKNATINVKVEYKTNEYFENGICIIEWGELIKDALPKDYIHITFEKDDSDENYRKLKVETFGNKYLF